MKTAFLVVVTIVFTSCSEVEYKPVEGRALVGPAANSSFANYDYGMPIYEGAPPWPWVVIGGIKTSDRAMSIEGGDHAAVRVAKARDADALIKVSSRSRFSGTSGGWNAGWGYNFAGGSDWSQAVYLDENQYLAIKKISK